MLTTHINDLGRLLINEKKIRIFLRVAFAVLSLAILIFVRLNYDNQPIVGDQPHYMLMEYSLVHDRDFNLANNFANHDSDTFGIYPPDGLTAAGQVGPGQSKTPDHQYSIHGIGLPLLMWPGYVLGGTFGVQIVMMVIAVGVLYLTYYWTKHITKSIKYSFIASLGLFVSYLFYGLAGYIFPDIVMAAVIVGSLLILAKAPHNPMWQAILGVILGFSLLVHYKMLAFAAFVILCLCYITWKQFRKIPYAAIITITLFGALLLYLTHEWFGIWNPSGVLADLGVGPRPAALLNNLSAVLFDSARGIIPNSPIFLLVFLGLPIWFRKNKLTLAMTLICIALPVAAFVVFSDWRGGDSPAGRYAMNFLPVLAPAMALAIQYLRTLWERLLVALLFIITAAITVYFAKIELGWLGVTSPISSPILYNTRLAFDRIFPQFDVATQPTGKSDWLKVALYYSILLGLVIYGWYLSKNVKKNISQ